MLVTHRKPHIYVGFFFVRIVVFPLKFYILSTSYLVYMIAFSPFRSFSHLLIIACIGVSLLGFSDSSVIATFGFQGLTFATGDITKGITQVLLFQFLHGGPLHLMLNSYFLYVAGTEIEARMSRERFLWFFITTTLFVAAGLYFFENPAVITIGMSGFCMALLSYLWIDLWTIKHPMAMSIGIMLVLNIAIGLSNTISFYGHVCGAIWGIVWWMIRSKQ